MDKIYFHLPGLFRFFQTYRCLIELFEERRECFYDNVEIGSIYGAPNRTLWNSGRIEHQLSANVDEICVFMGQHKIPCRLTFSNCLLEEKHLYDTFCNKLCDQFYDDHNGIIVNSPLLERYIRDNYPNYQIISSTTKCITDKDVARAELKKDYDSVVIDYNFNKDLVFLMSLPNKEKIELLINPVCQPKCPRRFEHYKDISESSLFISFNEFECPYQGIIFYNAKKNPLFISKDEIDTVYAPLGIRNFKIEGRTTHEDDLIEILLYYLVKPECRVEIRELLYYKDYEEIKYI